MCGIAGIVDLKGQRDIDPNLLKRMADAMLHRGPDGEGFYREPGIGLAHRRLAIIDIEGGKQPWRTQTRPAVMTFNGEIYNYADLAKTLTAQGVTLKTRSDTETLAEGISLFGSNFLSSVHGMFSFGHWREDTRTLFLARDRVGEKPLYYGQSADGYFLFASEIGALLASGKFDTAINPEAVADYFWFGYVPDPKSIYQGIKKLPPGHHLTLAGDGTISLKPWWQLDYQTNDSLEYARATQEMGDHLDRSVRAQMISDVPLGAFLSGGADSAAIVCAMASTNGASKPVTCSIGFEDNKQDERPYARSIAEHFDTIHHEEIAELSATTMIDKVALAFGEPFADSSALPTSIVARLARRHVTVALSGDGGDEVFAGYRRYPFFLGEEKLRGTLPHALRKMVFGPLGKAYPKLDNFPRPLRFKTTLQALGDSQGHAYARATAIMLPDQAHALMSDDLLNTLSGYSPVSQVESLMNEAGTNDPLSRALYADMKLWLAGRMLVKVDRASMMHSLEVRPPLLDHTLIEWAARLPSPYKLGGGLRKRILKDAIKDRLPRGYLERPKSGFALPLQDWLSGRDNPILKRLKQSSNWRDSAMINAHTVETMIQQQENGQHNHAQALWSVIMFDAFLRQHIPDQA